MVNNGVLWWSLVLSISSVAGEWYDTYTGNLITEERLAALKLNNLTEYCAIEVKICSLQEPRRLDYSCNNIHYPPRGARLTPFYRLLPPDYAIDGGLRTSKKGTPLPNARALRMALVPDARISNKKFTHLLTNMAVFIAGDTTTVHDTINYLVMTQSCCLPGGDRDPRCMPIKVPNNDMYLRTGPVRCLNLTRAITYQRLGCIPDTLPPERVNIATPLLDLSHVYGTDERKALKVREGRGGKLRAEKIKGKDWPPGNGVVCMQNDRRKNETRCHESAEATINSLIGVNIGFLWFLRQHNYLAERLSDLNPCWSDEQLFMAVKEINIAIWQNIVFNDLMPNIIDSEYLEENGVISPGSGYVDDYDPSMEPRVSLEHVIATRWFHTMQEGRLNLYDMQGNKFGQLAAVDMTLRTGILPLNNTIEGITQGTFRQACASDNYAIDPDMGERSLGGLQFVSDVMADDIMKGRDAGLPSYNRYRKLCNLPVAKDFHDLFQWMPQTQVEALMDAYDEVDDIDLLAGILGEKPMAGSIPGPTLVCIMVEQLLRWRRSDRFFFENTMHVGAFTPEQLGEIRKMRMSKVVCDHGDSVHSVQYNAFQLPGPGNEITPCSQYPDLRIEAWKDYTCTVKHEGTQHNAKYATNYQNPWWEVGNY